MSKQKLLWRLIALLVLALYIGGMLLMIFRQFGNGVTLWALSTVIGGLALYVRRTNEKKAADEREFEEAERAYQEKMAASEQKQEQ